MNPAASVILFTVLSGTGFGCLALLSLTPRAEGWMAFLHWGLGYGLAVSGLLASTFHLGNPQRALRAFTQWRTSWLSREAWAAVVALLVMAPMALSDWLGLDWPRVIGWVGAAFAVATVFSTSMIYAQLKTVPRWNQGAVPALFLAFAAAGGALAAGWRGFAVLALGLLGVAIVVNWRRGEGAFARAGSTLKTATGLGASGQVKVFELPHTGGNYLMREMIHVVGRRHVPKLRMIAALAGVVLPAVIVVLSGSPVAFGLALGLHLVGALAQRWLFFAEAEHVVGLYYGKR